jgi:alpha-ribazole phosphatase
MEIYLIRHTKPDIAKGICYGQTDLDVVASFEAEAAAIQTHIPDSIREVHSSPLQRCSKLASYLFPDREIAFHDHLMEIHCGDWEMQAWDAIPAADIQPWMDDFVQVTIPGGESYITLFDRVVARFEAIAASGVPAVIVAHGGVIRSILAHISSTPLIDSFTAFSLHYGCVVRLHREEQGWGYTMLHNPATKPETHKPSGY